MLNKSQQIGQDLLDSLVCFNCSVIFKARDLRIHKGFGHTQFSVEEIMEALKIQVKKLQRILNKFSEVDLQDSFRQQIKQLPPQLQNEKEELMRKYPMLIEQYRNQLEDNQEECNILSNEKVDYSYLTKHIKVYKENFLIGDKILQETEKIIRDILKFDNEFKQNLQVRIDNLAHQSKQLGQEMKKLLIFIPQFSSAENLQNSDKNLVDLYESITEYADFSKSFKKKLNDGSTYQGQWYQDKMHGFGKLIDPLENIFIGEFKEGKKNGKGTIEFNFGDMKGDKCEANFVDDEVMINQVKYLYSNGNIYEGAMSNFIREGKGEMMYNNGNIYIGEWKKGLFHGDGIFIWKNENIYEGQWKEDKKNGQGILYSSDDGRYEGQWKDDKKNGQGVFNFKDGGRYEGQWKDDFKDGKGILYQSDGGRYEGQWKDDKKNGKGFLYSSDGERYDGQWKDDQMNGQGIHYQKKGGRYEGLWKDNKRNGQGVFYYKEGGSFEGQWKEDKKNGQGIHYSSDDGRYEGQWKDDKKNGQGIHYQQNGDIYEGQWKDDKRDGQGVHCYKEGGRYEGQWKDNKRNGQGTCYFKYDGRYEGQWKDDKLHGKGIRFFFHGGYYSGFFEQDKLHGFGTYTRSDGKYIQGYWVNDKINGKCIDDLNFQQEDCQLF